MSFKAPHYLAFFLGRHGCATGLSPSLSQTDSVVTTTIVDNDAAQWAIVGPAITAEGTSNPVNVVVFTDAAGQFTFDGLNAGVYSITETQPDGFEDGADNGEPEFTITDDMFSNIQLGFGETINTNSFGERASNGGASGNPPSFPGLPRIVNSQISSLLNSFAGSPSPIYSGIPISGNANPLSLDSGRAVTGGYLVESDLDACESECPEVADPCGEPDPCDVLIDGYYESLEPVDGVMEQGPCDPCGEIIDPCDCGSVDAEVSANELVVVSPVDGYPEVDENAEADSTCDVRSEFGEGKRLQNFLERIRHWLS